MTRTKQKFNLERNKKSLKSTYYLIAFVFAAALLATEYLLLHTGVL